MAYPAYLRQRARELRISKQLSLDEIAARLALPKTTVRYWIRDLPLARAPRASPGQSKGNRKMQKNYRLKRQGAYGQGLIEYDELVKEPTFRDFVVLYVTEGYKRTRHTVSICNSDPEIIALAGRWLGRLSDKPLRARVQYHTDQSPEHLRSFWASTLDIPADRVRLHPKSNGGTLRTRIWRCAHGVAAVEVHDTLLRARLQACIDRLRADWEYTQQR